MTRTQRKALADLRKFGHLWPAGRGRFASFSSSPTYSKKTLQALVDAELAVWVYQDGVMPHIERRSYIRGGLS